MPIERAAVEQVSLLQKLRAIQQALRKIIRAQVLDNGRVGVIHVHAQNSPRRLPVTVRDCISLLRGFRTCVPVNFEMRIGPLSLIFLHEQDGLLDRFLQRSIVIAQLHIDRFCPAVHLRPDQVCIVRGIIRIKEPRELKSAFVEQFLQLGTAPPVDAIKPSGLHCRHLLCERPLVLLRRVLLQSPQVRNKPDLRYRISHTPSKPGANPHDQQILFQELEPAPSLPGPTNSGPPGVVVLEKDRTRA